MTRSSTPSTVTMPYSQNTFAMEGRAGRKCRSPQILFGTQDTPQEEGEAATPKHIPALPGYRNYRCAVQPASMAP